MDLGWVGNSTEKNNLHEVWSIEPCRFANKSYNSLNSNFTNKHTLSNLNLDSKFWSWFANTLQIEVLIHLVPKVLEPNKLSLWHFVTKDITKMKCSKLQTVYSNLKCPKTIQHNYYLSVTSVDSSRTKLTCIFLKHSTNT